MSVDATGTLVLEQTSNKMLIFYNDSQWDSKNKSPLPL